MAVHVRALVHVLGVVGTLAGFDHCLYVVVDRLYVAADDVGEVELRFVCACIEAYLFEPFNVLYECVLVVDSSRQDVVGSHVAEYAGFDLQTFHVVFEHDLVTCFEFALGEDVVGEEQFFSTVGNKCVECFRCCLEVVESAALCFFCPFFAVVVALETDLL